MFEIFRSLLNLFLIDGPVNECSFDLSYFFSEVLSKPYVIKFYIYFWREQAFYLDRMVKSLVKSFSNIQKRLWRSFVLLFLLLLAGLFLYDALSVKKKRISWLK